jgi:hypothetical protein
MSAGLTRTALQVMRTGQCCFHEKRESLTLSPLIIGDRVIRDLGCDLSLTPLPRGGDRKTAIGATVVIGLNPAETMLKKGNRMPAEREQLESDVRLILKTAAENIQLRIEQVAGDQKLCVGTEILDAGTAIIEQIRKQWPNQSEAGPVTEQNESILSEKPELHGSVAR